LLFFLRTLCTIFISRWLSFFSLRHLSIQRAYDSKDIIKSGVPIPNSFFVPYQHQHSCMTFISPVYIIPKSSQLT
jgi:hypothetical protein